MLLIELLDIIVDNCDLRLVFIRLQQVSLRFNVSMLAFAWPQIAVLLCIDVLRVEMR